MSLQTNTTDSPVNSDSDQAGSNPTLVSSQYPTVYSASGSNDPVTTNSSTHTPIFVHPIWIWKHWEH